MRAHYVLDTNVLFDVLSKQAPVVGALERVMADGALIYLCPFVHFEVRRGFLHRPHAERERRFNAPSHEMHWADLGTGDWNVGAQLWAKCESEGRRQSDADIMIAAFALNRGATVVTADMRSFDDLPVPTENWREE